MTNYHEAERGSGFAVSKARASDVRSVHELMVEWEQEGITIGQRATDEAYLSLLNECFLVARESHRIVGFVCARIVDNPGYGVISSAQRILEIEELFVQREARHQGIGSALLHAALQQAKEQGVSAFHVFSATRDTDSVVRFYR